MGRNLAVSEITVDRPASVYKAAELAIEERVEAQLTEAISLIGYSLPDHRLRPGEAVDLDLYWLATQDPVQDVDIQLVLRDSSGARVQNLAVPLVQGFPSSEWQKDDIWRANQKLLLRPELVSGVYAMSVQFGEKLPIELGSIEVRAPEHISERPPIGAFQQATFDGLGSLEGYEAPAEIRAGESLPVTLVWRATGRAKTSYRVFVQLIDDEGKLVTGSDQIPDAWQRPTSGWIMGEYIIDTHALNLPPDLKPGVYSLIVGLYDPDTMQRLRLNSGADAVTLNQPLELLP